MPGDPFKKVQRGQRLKIPAEAYNAFLDAAQAIKQSEWFASDALAFFRSSTIIKVKNVSGSNQPRFAIMGISTPIILPSSNLEEFKRHVTCNVVIPQKYTHHGRFVVLLEPIGVDKIGYAVAAGVTPVRLRVDPTYIYDSAEIIPGNTQLLQNQPHGSAHVLWVEPSTGTDRWAIVRLDDGDFQAHVYITSNIPDEQGYYPGIVQRYDIDTRTWQSLFPCKVIDINH